MQKIQNATFGDIHIHVKCSTTNCAHATFPPPVKLADGQIGDFVVAGPDGFVMVDNVTEWANMYMLGLVQRTHSGARQHLNALTAFNENPQNHSEE